MRHIMDLREPPTDLPDLDFNLTDVEQANAKVDMAVIHAHRKQQNERDQRQKG